MQRFVYHVTVASNLDSISAYGLRRSRGISSFPGYEGHTRGRIFVCDVDAVRCWWGKLEALVEHGYEPEDMVDGLHIPVVLRFEVDEALLRVDALGSRDCLSGESYFLEVDVPAEALEVWTGAAWLPVDEPGAAYVASCYVAKDEEVEEEYDGEINVWRDVELRLPKGYEAEE